MQTEAIVKFLQTQYSDEKLAALLAHAEDGKLGFASCCCFIGVSTANHPLKTVDEYQFGPTAAGNHMIHARRLPYAEEAEEEFLLLSEDTGFHKGNDKERRERLIPLIHAEMERRELLRSEDVEPARVQDEAVTVTAG